MDSAMIVVLVMICSSLHYAVYSNEYNTENDQIGETDGDGGGDGDCSLWVADGDAAKMPVPFTTNGRRHTIIYPDAMGRLNVGHNRGFKLSCAAGNRFASAALGNVSEALVACVGGDRLRYRGRVRRYADFACESRPKSQLRVTGETCQPENYTVAAVGFEADGGRFLELYAVCFDESTENSLYTWYDARSPYYDNHQKDSRRPAFVKSRELYGKTDVNKKYTVAEQRKTVAKILRSDELADKYIKSDSKHSLSRGHYAAKADFFFAYEQSATFYYANVAPQWQVFNGKLWADLEDRTRRRLARDSNGTRTAAGRVIVSGTYGSCTLPDVDGVQQPLFLDPPAGIPVPLFYWKLDYDVGAGDGLVYVGLNDPYREIDDSAYLCPNVCPDGLGDDDDDDGGGGGGKGDDDDANEDGADGDAPDDNKGLIYCCTKESFERVYGQLDPIVFGRDG